MAASPPLSPAKVVLLAAHFTATGDMASLAALTARRRRDVLRTELWLRLLLTYLPAHLPTAAYLPLLECVYAAESSESSEEEGDKKNEDKKNEDTNDTDDTDTDSAFSPLFPLVDLDSSAVDGLSDEQAARKARQLRLRPLTLPDTLADSASDWFSVFLILRAQAVDDGAGALPELPALVQPFLDRDPSQRLRTWAVSTLLPVWRRYCEYYNDIAPSSASFSSSSPASPSTTPPKTLLADFEHLPGRVAVSRLISQTGKRHSSTSTSSSSDSPLDETNVGRDLRGLVGPWLYDERRWNSRKNRRASAAEMAGEDVPEQDHELCPGWEQMLQWLLTQAASPTRWRLAVAAVEQWDGPGDVDLGSFGSGRLWLDDDEQEYLERRYARAALATAYLVPEASADALARVHSLVGKIRSLLDLDAAAAAASSSAPSVQAAASLLPPVSSAVASLLASLASSASSASSSLPAQDTGAPAAAASHYYLRHDLLDPRNALTAPSPAATELLHALVLSAHLLTSFLGCPCTVRRAGELALLPLSSASRGARDQQAEAAKALHWIATNGPRGEDRYWIKARNEILWLRDWGADENDDDGKPAPTSAPTSVYGVFSHVSREFIEVEFLKALLVNTRYSLARALYEDVPDLPLPRKIVQETVFAAALHAYDNASNPNRTRGGLKKCNDIIHTFPQTINASLPEARRIEALLAATHALSTYRLVLKQGEPFTPVVLRVHPDPISILGRVLEQNPKSYTHLHALVDMAVAMVDAGLTKHGRAAPETGAPTESKATEALLRTMAERRVTAMCIDAAINEDDFETAYSYVVSRLSTPLSSTSNSNNSNNNDPWSWRAALAAGKYRRNERTVRPTHLGTATANLDIRHLEQRIDCLATALRIAPPDTLQEILSAYRHCEEELEVAVQAEAEQEAAWDEAGDWQQQQQQQQQRKYKSRDTSSEAMPGGFDRPPGPAPMATPLASRAAAAARTSSLYYPQQQRQHQHQHPHQQHQQYHQKQQTQAADDAPLSLFDLSRATAQAAQRNLSALTSLRQTRQNAFFGIGGGEPRDEHDSMQASSGSDSNSTTAPQLRKRDQLREAAMGTLTSGVGWLIGAQPIDRGSARAADE